ncbi:hypothetical protein HOP50_02g14530 [Chloropicon primus]|uniref:Uncharacterized protein n=1 Tax=Chloropicon primus TaxID=1764295 RepID=A0A5B8MEX0_9CHLO|nr:hypothetical protein A3770_02p14650 [Chloropicon primus]UPQ98155.1 hypothetical protein HOP50_02g14530 [Chloropicon primus]|eukprot:QDZ18947.1 hypothetical protein A3770_02p14650 [Chloropicon primus]
MVTSLKGRGEGRRGRAQRGGGASTSSARSWSGRDRLPRTVAEATRGEEDPLQHRIYLEVEGRGSVREPEPLPVTHSSAFLQRSRGAWKDSDYDEGASDGEEVETSPVVVAFNDAISSETGKTVRKGMVEAAKLSVDAGVVVTKGAAKVAMPAVSWAVKGAVKAAMSPKKKK